MSDVTSVAEHATGRAPAPAVPGPGGRVLAAIGIAAALTPLNSTMIAVALPSISATFQTPASTVTVWVVTAYLVATIACQMPAGSVADRLGYARTLTVGRWMFALGAVAAFAAPTLALLVVGRLLMAAGGALMVPTAMAMLRVAIPIERRPRAFGAMGALMGGAAALGPALGGLVIARASWRVLFVINLPLTLLSWLLQPRAFDAGVPKPATRGAGWFRNLATLFRRPAFTAGSAVIALQNFSMYGLLVLVPFMLGGAAAGSQVGAAMMALTATFALTSPIGGRIAESVGTSVTVLAGGLLGAAGIVALILLATPTPLDIGLRLLLVGLGLGLSTGPSQAAALSAIDAERSGTASAALSTLRYLGAIAGTAVLSVTMAGAGQGLAEQHLALWVFASAFGLSAVSALGLGRSR